jgi:hypothetical protein
VAKARSIARIAANSVAALQRFVPFLQRNSILFYATSINGT